MSDKFNLEGFKVDENNVCTADGGFVGDLTGNVAGDITGSLTMSPSIKYSATASVGSDKRNIGVSSTDSVVNLTLASPTSSLIGYVVFIACYGYTNACTITSDFGGALTTITFSAVGQGVTLCCNSDGAGLDAAWFVVGNNGAVIS